MSQSAICTFDEKQLIAICKKLGKKDADLANIIKQFGYPPYFNRNEGFETLLRIILEQQVSLASANAAYQKLKDRINIITPQKILALSNEELKACYFSRQKISYVKALAKDIEEGLLDLPSLKKMNDIVVIDTLKKVKGIGNWTADIYLMMALHRQDCFPLGDVALIASIKDVKQLPKATPVHELETIIESWKPYRTVAAFMLWWSYINKKKIKWEF